MVWNGQTRRKNCHPFHIGQKAKKKKKNTHRHMQNILRVVPVPQCCVSTKENAFYLSLFAYRTWSRNNRSVWNAISWFGRRLRPARHICPRSQARLPRSGIYTCSETTAQTPFFPFAQRCAELFSLSNCWFRSFEAHLFAVYLGASFAAYPEVSEVLFSCSNF